MDNLCHTLVGAALAQAGLKRRTALGTATLMIAANLPDVDGLAVPLGTSLEWRRGWTHGVVALAIWPFVLALAMMAWARWGRPFGPRPRLGPVILLSAIGVLSHPLLDFMNSYGVRWLMPFADRWYYGDSLFIVDPWLLALLGIGIWVGRRWERAGRPDWIRPARLTLTLGALYVAGMIGGTLVARRAIVRETGPEPAGRRPLMATAVPVNPFRRQVILDAGDRYRVGTYRFLDRPALRWAGELAKGPIGSAAVREAARSAIAKGFVHWARWPAARILPAGDSIVVRLYDLRYTDGSEPSWAGVDVRLPGPSPGSRSGAGSGAPPPRIAVVGPPPR